MTQKEKFQIHLQEALHFAYGMYRDIVTNPASLCGAKLGLAKAILKQDILFLCRRFLTQAQYPNQPLHMESVLCVVARVKKVIHGLLVLLVEQETVYGKTQGIVTRYETVMNWGLIKD